MADPHDDELEIRVRHAASFSGGRVFREWESFSVERSLRAISGKLSIAVGSRRPWPISMDDIIEVRVGGVPILTGHIDTYEGEASKRGRTLSMAGRDLTADLVDCSSMNEPGEWILVSFEQLIEDLVAPFGIEVTIDAEGVPDFYTFKMQTGESAFQAIERACRLRGLLCYTPGDGTLRISPPGSERATVRLVEGENVLRSKIAYNNAKRFRTYVVRAQRAGSDEEFGEVVAHVEGRAVDDSILRERPLLVVAENSMNEWDAQRRAEWEATYRAAAARPVDVDVVGLRQRIEDLASPLWAPNLIARTVLPTWGVDEDLLVESISYKRSRSSGTVTRMRLVRRDAYLPKDEVPAQGDPGTVLLGGEDPAKDAELSEEKKLPYILDFDVKDSLFP